MYVGTHCLILQQNVQQNFYPQTWTNVVCGNIMAKLGAHNEIKLWQKLYPGVCCILFQLGGSTKLLSGAI